MGHLRILEQGQIQIPTLARGGGSRGLHWLVHYTVLKEIYSSVNEAIQMETDKNIKLKRRMPS